MTVSDDKVVKAIADYYRNVSGGFDIDSEFAVERFKRVRNVLDSLSGLGYSDLDVLKLAVIAMELEVTTGD